VARVRSNGDEIRVPDPAADERAAWRRLIFAVLNSDALPDGLRLRHSGWDHGDLVMRLVPGTADNEPRSPEVAQLAIPERLTNLHPILSATRAHVGRQSSGSVDTRRVPGVLHVTVAVSSLQRALKLTQAMVDEAVRRGHEVRVVDAHGCPGGLGVFVQGHGYELVFKEESDRTPHVPLQRELARESRDSWARIPEWDYTLSGRLQLCAGHDHHDTRLAGDRKRWRLEDRLAQALDKIEDLAAGAEARRLEAELREAERRQSWEAAMERARERLLEATRVAHLQEQVDRWQLAADVRAFIEQIRGGPTAHVVEPSEEAWLQWASEYADAIDPMSRPVGFPPEVQPTPDALRPHLDGWSPYGPEREYCR